MTCDASGVPMEPDHLPESCGRPMSDLHTHRGDDQCGINTCPTNTNDWGEGGGGRGEGRGKGEGGGGRGREEGRGEGGGGREGEEVDLRCT